MAINRVTPTDRERRFEAHELFFSTTDRKGHILSGNEVFSRISGWDRDELIGAPHNIIRHPDMPRAVFQVVWDYLLAGHPVAGYVKNMAKNGDAYWVMATIVPHGDGFLSVRLKPSGPHWEAVQAVYPIVRATELELEEQGMPVREVIEHSVAQLVEILQGAGFPTYTDFMRAALPTELQLRGQAIAGRPHVGPTSGGLYHLGKHLDDLFASLDHYLDTHEALSKGLVGVRNFAEDIRLGAMNALLAATHLDGQAVTLGTVADLMGASARSVAEQVGVLTDEAAPIMSVLHDLAFSVSLAKVQVDLARFFAEEIQASEGGHAEHGGDLRDIVGLVTGEVQQVMRVRGDIEAQLMPLRGSIGQLEERIKVLRSLDVAGRIEIARIPGADRVVTLFDQIRTELGTVGERITAMHAAVDRQEAAIDVDALARDAAAATDEADQLAAV
ncbi:MAG: PAS domain-containing protein [Thermoleophilia bacterium]